MLKDLEKKGVKKEADGGRGLGGLCPHRNSRIQLGCVLNGGEQQLGECYIEWVGKRLSPWVG